MFVQSNLDYLTILMSGLVANRQSPFDADLILPREVAPALEKELGFPVRGRDVALALNRLDVAKTARMKINGQRVQVWILRNYSKYEKVHESGGYRVIDHKRIADLLRGRIPNKKKRWLSAYELDKINPNDNATVDSTGLIK